MVSNRQLLQTVEAALLAGHDLPPQQRADVAHVLHLSLPAFHSFLQYPAPKATDRTQVSSKEVRLPNAPPTRLDDQDVHIALKLSDDLFLNEVECVGLLVTAHQEWSLLGRDPLEILRLTAGLWFTERRALITTLQLLLRAVVLDEDLDPDLVADIHQFLEGLFKSGLRQTMITLIKDLNHDEPAGSGGPGVEQYMIDSRGALVQRRNVALRERLSLCQCLVFSCLIVRMGAQEMKELYILLKDCSYASDVSPKTVKLQIAYTLLFVILISLMSDALSGTQEMVSVLSPDSVFQKEFQEQIMESGGDDTVEGFASIVCLAWAVFSMLTSSSGRVGLTSLSSPPFENSFSCLALDRACEHNAFGFLVVRILKTSAFQNDDEDMIFMYGAYLHKLLTSFLSQPLGRDKVKELRDSAMLSFESQYYDTSHGLMEDDVRANRQMVHAQAQPFISLLELITEVYKQVPDLTIENDVLWNFVRFASEAHTNHVTLVAFLTMLTALASSVEGAKKVYLLLQGRTSRSIGWHTLFNSLNVYAEHFKQSLQTTGALLPLIQEGDAKALEAYLRVLKKVMENGNKVERSQWFLDIEPLFKLLSFENVPPFLKGAIRNAISTFVGLSSGMKDKVWALLEQYDLPMVAGSSAAEESMQQHQPQIYDMSFELNEVEASHEEYPSTLSYIKLINVLISNETDVTDKGARFLGIFRFVRDHVFASYSQRAYVDPAEKWQLVVACLRHFQLMLRMFIPTEEDIRSQVDGLSEVQIGMSTGLWGSSGVAVQLPTIDIMKDFMSGKTIFRNLMSVLMLGVNFLLEERMNEIQGIHVEDAVHASLQLLLLALNKDTNYVDFWRPLYQPLDTVLAHDNRQIVVLLEYVRYDAMPAIQQSSIQIMTILSARMPQLVSMITEAGIGRNLIEDYGACLEGRSQDIQAPENLKEDLGFLILQLLLSNLSRPTPNVTHLLLKFDVDMPVERTILQPKRNFSCLRVLLNILDTLDRPDVNAILHELGFQLFYELCVDSFTSAATIELLQAEKYKFFCKHLDTFAGEPLPKRNTNQMLRTSSLHQRAWLLKLLALELHVSDMDIITQRENCRHLLSHLLLEETSSLNGSESALITYMVPPLAKAPTSGLQRIKALELLDVVQFQPPDIHLDLPIEFQVVKDDLMVTDILGKPATVEEGGVYFLSERGDRLIDLAAFRDRLWQEYKRVEIQHSISFNEQRQAISRNAVQHLLRWGWKYNRNVEEQAAQIHMLVGWSQIMEVAVSQRFELLDFRLPILLEILDASLTATTSPDCSLKMALSLSQVVMTCMAKLQELSFTCPAGDCTDDVTYMDVFSSARLSNSACQTILSKLVPSILRSETSELLRRRQYTILICYLHYCRGPVDPDVSMPLVQSLLLDGQDGQGDQEIKKLDREQTELDQINALIVKHEATALINVLAKDAIQGTEMGKQMAIYALDALLGMDGDQILLSQLQSKGLIQACLMDISTNSYQAVLLASPMAVRRLYTLEAELALLLRVGFQNKKRGAQSLFAMSALQHLTSCRAIDVQLSEDAKWEKTIKMGSGLPSQHERHHQIVSPVLRLVLCLTSLVENTDSLEKDGNEVANEILEFIKVHQGLFTRILRDDRSGINLEDLEELELVTAILSKVWHLRTSDDLGFNQALCYLASIYFCPDEDSKNRFVNYIREAEHMSDLASDTHEMIRKLELLIAHVRCNLISFLYNMVAKQGLRFHYSNPSVTEAILSSSQFNLGRHSEPNLKLVADLLDQVGSDLDTATKEMSLLLAKVQDVNELSRHEVDEIVKAYSRVERNSDADSIRNRRYVAMVEMCSAAGNRECLIALHHHIIEHALNILYMHFEKELQLPEQLQNIVKNTDHIGSFFGTKADLRVLNDKLLPTLQRLERLNEERTGHGDQHIQRLVRSLKSHITLGLT